MNYRYYLLLSSQYAMYAVWPLNRPAHHQGLVELWTREMFEDEMDHWVLMVPVSPIYEGHPDVRRVKSEWAERLGQLESLSH